MHEPSSSVTTLGHRSPRQQSAFELPGVVQTRLNWIHSYEEKKDVQSVCQKFGISRKTFYKWLKRYRDSHGDPASLQDHSRRPHHFPRAIPKETLRRILQAKKETGYGQRRLRKYLAKSQNIRVSEHTIWKMLKRRYGDNHNGEDQTHVEEKLLPGDRVVISIRDITRYINHDDYVQYTAIDRCTKLRISKIYRRHCWSSASDFVRVLLEKFPFAIKELCTPPDGPFTTQVPTNGVSSILFEPVPALLQKANIRHTILSETGTYSTLVETLEEADDEEFFKRRVYRKPEELIRASTEYITHYNNHRRHTDLNGLTPLQRLRMFPEFKHVLYFDPYT